MAYTKTQLVRQDAPVGYRLINGISDNIDSLKSDLEIEHVPLYADSGSDLVGWLGGGGSGQYTATPNLHGTSASDSPVAGSHETPVVSRGVAIVKQTYSDPLLITPYGVKLESFSGCIETMIGLDTGKYFFPIDGLTSVHGKATPIIEDSTGLGIPLDARVGPAIQNGTGATGLVVQTFKMQDDGSGNYVMLPYHLGFYLVVWGTRSASSSPVQDGFDLIVHSTRFSRRAWQRRTRIFSTPQ